LRHPFHAVSILGDNRWGECSRPETGLSGSKSGKMGSLRVNRLRRSAARGPDKALARGTPVPQTRRFFRIAPADDAQASRVPAWPRAALFGFEFVNEKHT
jgi:hypothetical protein